MQMFLSIMSELTKYYRGSKYPRSPIFFLCKKRPESIPHQFNVFQVDLLHAPAFLFIGHGESTNTSNS